MVEKKPVSHPLTFSVGSENQQHQNVVKHPTKKNKESEDDMAGITKEMLQAMLDASNAKLEAKMETLTREVIAISKDVAVLTEQSKSLASKEELYKVKDEIKDYIHSEQKWTIGSYVKLAGAFIAFFGLLFAILNFMKPTTLQTQPNAVVEKQNQTIAPPKKDASH